MGEINSNEKNQAQMMYYIDAVNVWSPANNKCIKVQGFVKEFRQTLIPGEAAVDALVKEVQEKVTELNALYPRTKTLRVTREGNQVYCNVWGNRADGEFVFTFKIEKVRRTYTTLETMLDEKENETKAE